MNSEILDTLESKATKDSPIFDALSWWEKKRIWFNVVVGASGFTMIFLFSTSFDFFSLLGILIYGFTLNMFYSIGFLLEAFNEYYLKTSFVLKDLRLVFFIGGTIVSALLTIFWAFTYYAIVGQNLYY